MRRLTGSTVKYIVLIVFALYAIIPIIVMWMYSLKSKTEIFKDPFALPTTLHWENLARAWTIGHFGQYMLSTFIIVLPTVFIVVSLSCLAGYAFGKLKFAGSKIFYFVFLMGLMVPFQSIMIPLYYLLVDINLLGTYWAMILPASALGLPFGIFLMQAFFRGLPPELMEAARIDGCNEFRVFLRVMLPLAGPGVSTLMVFNFMWTWNSFLMPMLYLNKESLYPMAVGLMFFSGRFTTDYGMLAAAVTISSLPVVIVYIIFQRHFIRGLTAGMLKQ